MMSDMGNRESDPREGRWIEIGRWSWVNPLMLVLTPAFIGLIGLLFQLTHFGYIIGGASGSLLPGIPRFVIEIATVLLLAGVAFGVALLVQRSRFPRVCVDLDTQRIRIGRTEMALSELIWARLDVGGWTRRRRRLLLRMGAALHPQALFDVSPTGRRALNERDRALLAAVIDGSDIEVPKTRDDPSGRFARYNFPNNITKATARTLVLTPPGPTDPVPIPDARDIIGGR